MWVWDVALFLLSAVSLTLGCEDSSVTCSAHSLMFIVSPHRAAISSLSFGGTKVSHCEEDTSLRFQKFM